MKRSQPLYSSDSDFDEAVTNNDMCFGSLSLSLSPDIPPAKTEAKNPSAALQRRLRPFHYLC